MKRLSISFLFIIFSLSFLAQASVPEGRASFTQRSYNIVFIGNSITYGALHQQRELTAPPVQCARWFTQRDDIDSVFFANCGRSGRTTYHFLPNAADVIPAGDKTYFGDVVSKTRALVKAQPSLPLVFSIMLGTNDAVERTKNPHTEPADYVKNLTCIIDSLLKLWPDAHVVLQRPIYNTSDYITKNGSVASKKSLKLMNAYYEQFPMIVRNCKAGHVHIGDAEAYDYFRQHYKTDVFEEKDAKEKSYWLHPNEQGARKLAEYWGKAILKAVGALAQRDVMESGTRDRLWRSFITPPDSIRVGCYYYWVNERVDPKGVKADLQWMKDNGITLAFLATDIRNRLQGDTTVQIYGKNKFQSKLWWKNLRTALKTAGELGIEMGIFNCPGWSQSGGPWIKPDEAMRNWTPNGIEICKTKQGTDVVCSPCSPEATGLEVDKLSRSHVKKHFEAFFGEILRRIPANDRPTLTTVVVDSWERGKQNYTDSIFVKFRQRFGYELDYQNEACQKDLNQLIADLVASEYMGGLTEKAHEYGLRTWCEPYAHSPFPANSITYGSAADEVAAEFWVGDRKFRKKEVDAALWSARRSGKNRVWAESFTDGWPELAQDDWSFEKLKPIADRYFHAGINASILHVVISQPGDDREPAVRPWFGTYFDRRSAHAADLKPLVRYLRRCNFMLQLGRPYNNATDQRVLDDGTVIRFTDDSRFEVTFPDGSKELWNP